MKLLGTFELILLAALARLGDNAYGASILREIEERTGRVPAKGATYTTLGRLEVKGLVSSRWGEAIPERGGRAKRYFRITAKGIKAMGELGKAINARFYKRRLADGR